jgi:transketolase
LTKTDVKNKPAFEAGNYSGSNFHFGVREHAMGAIVNGMALTYLRSYAATFLVLADYMRPPIRLSAVMELPSITVFTHDSIGVGEDGPTHQPIEPLVTLRAIPGLDTIRPCDANGVAVAWKAAMLDHGRPTALIFSRQALPPLDRSKYAAAEGLMKGGYVLPDSDDPELILISTGSEVSLVIAAHEKLKEQGARSRVVPMPSWSRYELQDDAYKESVLPKVVKARPRGRDGRGDRLGSLCRAGGQDDHHVDLRCLGVDRQIAGQVRVHRRQRRQGVTRNARKGQVNGQAQRFGC